MMESKREAQLAGVATRLAELLKRYAEPHPGSSMDEDVVRALAWYEEVIRGS